MSAGVVTEAAGLTAAWLSEALGGRVDDVVATPVGTGQIGTCYRLALTGEGVPTSVLVKLPAADQGSRDLLAGAYRGELVFEPARCVIDHLVCTEFSEPGLVAL